MKIELFFSGERVDMYSDTNIRFTLQANDIAELKDRQASFTNEFKIPKTERNVQIMDGLGIASDGSRVPYKQQKCQIKTDGYSLIEKGWANIKDDDYSLHIYSGVIEIFKKLSNKTLRELSDSSGKWLSVFDHSKNISTVAQSQTNQYYRYMAADFNGKTIYDGKLNIDYLIPFVNCLYIFDKIHESIGFVYQSSIKNKIGELWMSYPKFSDVFANASVALEVSSKRMESNDCDISNAPRFYYLTYEPPAKITSDGFLKSYGGKTCFGNKNGWWVAQASGKYKIEITGYMHVPKGYNGWIRFAKNSKDKSPSDAYRNGEEIGSSRGSNINVEWSTTQFFSAGESFSFVSYMSSGSYTLGASIDAIFTVRVTKVDDEEINVSDAIGQLKATDFIKEIFNRFGLTAFTDEFSNVVRYVTVDERLNPPKVLDWTDKYVKRNSETYVYSNYARQNVFEYKYSNENENHFDGIIEIDNTNLSDRRSVYKSFSYAAEAYVSSTMNLPVLKMYEQQVKEKNGITAVEYKGINNRYFFVNATPYAGPIELISETTKETASSNMTAAKFIGYQSIVDNVYPEFKKLVERSRVHTVDLNLNLVDIITLDQYALYYFAQEQQYYIINKISFDEKKAFGEFVRVNLATEIKPPPIDPLIDSVIIGWEDGMADERTGTSDTVSITVKQMPDPERISSIIWYMQKTSSDFPNIIQPGPGGLFPAETGGNAYIMKVMLKNGNEITSNTLYYIKQDV